MFINMPWNSIWTIGAPVQAVERESHIHPKAWPGLTAGDPFAMPQQRHMLLLYIVNGKAARLPKRILILILHSLRQIMH